MIPFEQIQSVSLAKTPTGCSPVGSARASASVRSSVSATLPVTPAIS